MYFYAVPELGTLQPTAACPCSPLFPPSPQPDSRARLVPKTLSLLSAHHCCTQLLPITSVCHDIEHPVSLPSRRNTTFSLTYFFSIPTNNCYGQVQTTSSRLTWIRHSDPSDFFPLMHFSSFLVLYFPPQTHCLLPFSISRHLCETHNHISLKNLQELI